MNNQTRECAIDDHWAAVQMMARAIPSSVNLADDVEVAIALLEARFTSADFYERLDEIMSSARLMRKEESSRGVGR